MNVSMHEAAFLDSQVYEIEGRQVGKAGFEEQSGRSGSLSMFFESSADCQAAADGLAELARQMREGEAVR